MKRSSVFVLQLLILVVSCSEKQDWKTNEFVGVYSLLPEEKPLMDQWFSSDKTSGWNYNDPCSANLELKPDSTFKSDHTGSAFQCPTYFGNWKLSSDTIYLYNVMRVCCPDCSYPDNEWELMDYTDTLVILSKYNLEVVSLSGTENGRILRRN